MTKNKRMVAVALALGLGLGVVAVGRVVFVDRGPGPRFDAVHSQPQRSPDRFWSSGSEQIPSRRVDSAAIPNYGGVESDDWDSSGPAGRVERTEALILELRERIAACADEDEREVLRDRAAQALSVARADYFSDPALAERYAEYEESFEQ